MALGLVMLFGMVNLSLAVQNIDQLNKELDQQAAPQPQDDYLLFGFLKLAAVLAIIVLAVWLLLKLFGKQIRSRMQGSWLRVIDEVSLGQNRGVVLCEIGGRIYALGVTDHQINMLFDIDDPDLLADIELANLETVSEENEAQSGWTAGFNKWLDILGGKRYRRPPRPKNFHRLVQEQSQRMKDIYDNELHNERRTSHTDDEP